MARRNKPEKQPEQTTPTLSPCPFCGNEKPQIRSSGPGEWRVECPVCGVEMCVTPADMRKLFDATARQFIANRWNRRAGKGG